MFRKYNIRLDLSISNARQANLIIILHHNNADNFHPPRLVHKYGKIWALPWQLPMVATAVSA